jgi:hypothetical protein
MALITLPRRTEYDSLKIGTDTDYMDVNESGHLTFHGTARPWRDELGDALILQQQGTGVSTNPVECVVEFAANANLNDYLYKNIQLNHDRYLISVIDLHIHWFQEAAAVPHFLMDYRWQKLGSSKVTAWTRQKINTPVFTYASGSLHQICKGITISPPTGTNLSDIIQIRIYRDNANTSTLFTGADAYSGAVGLMSIDAHFMINSTGSDQEYVK